MIKLSVLIPVFNEDIRPLANDLKDLMSEGVEVIFGDDASDNTRLSSQNHDHISGIANFQYIQRDRNLGFCENRNELGRLAKGEYLLFLDADVRINNPKFIKNWMEVLPVNGILCGGNVYQTEPPSDSGKLLKWRFGKEREEASVVERKQNPYLRFWASNFLVPKALFVQIPFDRKSRHYGYNDTVYAYLLMKKGVVVDHVDNPVLNTGLLDKETFLNRSKEAVHNLLFFEGQEYIEKDFGQYIKLLAFYNRMKNFGLAPMTYSILKLLKKSLYNNLRSENPRIRNLDLLKLYYLLEARRS